MEYFVPAESLEHGKAYLITFHNVSKRVRYVEGSPYWHDLDGQKTTIKICQGRVYEPPSLVRPSLVRPSLVRLTPEQVQTLAARVTRLQRDMADVSCRSIQIGDFVLPGPAEEGSPLHKEEATFRQALLEHLQKQLDQLLTIG